MTMREPLHQVDHDGDIRVVDIPAETLLVAIVYRDGTVHVDTSKPRKWAAEKLCEIAEHLLALPAEKMP